MGLICSVIMILNVPLTLGTNILVPYTKFKRQYDFLSPESCTIDFDMAGAIFFHKAISKFLEI